MNLFHLELDSFLQLLDLVPEGLDMTMLGVEVFPQLVLLLDLLGGLVVELTPCTSASVSRWTRMVDSM